MFGENVVFTGSGTRPGVGVPMVVVSGRLAAERVLGAHPAARRGRTHLV
jgi:phytoene desaturase